MKVPTPSGADGPGTEQSGSLPVPHEGRPRKLFQSALLEWYRVRARPLRIRSTREPWAVLVAEVMAQQTQISRVDAAWAGFLARFPTPARLAEASTADALRAWSGLGYNRRALGLQRAARVIETRHAGRVPDGVADLEALPGVGPYTSRAVAALAYGHPVAAVDTNVRRVMTRLLGRDLGPRQLQAVADDLVAREDPGTWTNASMELGATLCRSRHPACGSCPLSRWCASAGRLEVVVGVTVGEAGVPRGATRARSGGVSAERTRPGGAGPPGRAAADVSAVPFERTSRWLRGRIVARLRDLEDGAWAQMPESIGAHGPDRVAVALAALRRDGLLEQRADGSVRLPSTAPASG